MAKPGRGGKRGGGEGPIQKRQSDLKNKEELANRFVIAGGKRWTKNGHDRIYLSNIMSHELDLDAPDAPWSMSRSVRNIMTNIIDSAYYDANTGKLEYKKSPYSWANNHVEKEFNRLLGKVKK